MLRYLKLTILVALALSDSIENYQGDFKPIKFYGDNRMNPTCVPGAIEKTRYACKCDNRDTPIIALKIPRRTLHVAALVVVSNEEVINAVGVKCDTHGYPVPLLVFRPLSDGYMIMYTGEQGTDKFVLLRKKPPSLEELVEFEKTVDVLNTKQGTVICVREYEDSKDMSRGSSKKNTSTTSNVWEFVKN